MYTPNLFQKGGVVYSGIVIVFMLSAPQGSCYNCLQTGLIPTRSAFKRVINTQTYSGATAIFTIFRIPFIFYLSPRRNKF